MNIKNPTPIDQKLALFLGTGLGSGYLPKSPGTWGSAMGLIIWMLLHFLAPHSLLVHIIIAFLVCIVGMWATKGALKALQANQHSQKDPQCIVIDEWAGLSIALIGASLDFTSLIAAFLLFRLFDIWKPGPVRRAEELEGAWGIMADDIVAGCIALVLRLSCQFLLVSA